MRIGLAVVVILTLCACGGSDDATSGPQPVNVNGSWYVNGTVTGGSQAPPGTVFSATVDLAQGGSSVSGLFVSGGGFTGTVTGSVSGRALSFTMTQDPPCVGTFTGSAQVNGSNSALTGAYAGSDCNGTFAASFIANK